MSVAATEGLQRARRSRASAVEGLPHLLEELDRLCTDRRGPLELKELEDLFSRLRLRRGDVTAFQFFDAKCYQRNRIRRTDHYELLLICWAPEQKSPVHDHTGSACVFRVLEGTCHEERFSRADDGAVCCTGEMLQYPSGSVCASEDQDIHRVANKSCSDNLCTLHLYSPPLDAMRTYPAA